jgi:hypothetical protein
VSRIHNGVSTERGKSIDVRTFEKSARISNRDNVDPNRGNALSFFEDSDREYSSFSSFHASLKRIWMAESVKDDSKKPDLL